MKPGRLLMIATVAGLTVLAAGGCKPHRPPKRPRDPHLVKRPENLREDSTFLSPPILNYPIYACAQSVVVRGFVPGAKIEVFVDGNPTPVGGIQSWLTGGQNIVGLPAFVVGQHVTAKQTFGGATSSASNMVTVTDHTADYPNGLPKPHLGPTPCLDCGRAVGIADVVPGAWVKVISEKARSGGGFDPPVQVGGVSDFPYAIVSPAFAKGDRIHAESGLCTDLSPPSDPEIVQAEPPTIPTPKLDPLHEGVQIAVFWGPGGGGDPLVNGATLELLADPGAVHVGGQPTPGGGQQVWVSPPVSTANTYRPSQALCSKSPPGPGVGVVPCAQQPPARIRPPLPGDTQVELTDFIPGAEILVFANGVEIGDGGGPIVVLSRALTSADTVVVLQKIGDCESALVYQIPVGCSLGGDDRACSADWPAFRHNALRSATQPNLSALADPYKVKQLKVLWRFPANGSVGGFRASPVIFDGRVFIGSGDGHMYALDANTGKLLWQFPLSGAPALTSSPGGFVNPSGMGIASSATIGRVREGIDAVIFAAPDRSVGAGLGSGRLFALNPQTGALIWASPELARLTGNSMCSTTELHENFGYSAPLVVGQRVYAGIADHADCPIQRGRVVAVNLADGLPVPGFSFEATDTRGGGIWDALAGGLTGAAVYATTGNARQWNIGGSQGPPKVNHSLSMLRLDPATGGLRWKLQPVPFDLDDDPDWSSGASLMAATCGEVALSTQKDGWTYAANAGAGGPAADVRWQYPPTHVPFAPFASGDGTVHGDSRYQNPGAAWHDVFITMDGGDELDLQATTPGDAPLLPGFSRLHGLNVCGGQRVRWILDVPGAGSAGSSRDRRLGPPTVTRGIVYVGTATGRLVALADPTAWPPQGSRCSRSDVADIDCAANGYYLVPVPSVLANLSLGAGSIFTEPSLAENGVFVSTDGGVVFRLQPGP